MTVQRAMRKIASTIRSLWRASAWKGWPGCVETAMILLDLHLPKMSGIEFLKELRGNPELCGLSVVVLTSSNEPRDRAAAFEYDVEDYNVKPHSFDEFTEVIKTILAYWSPSHY